MSSKKPIIAIDGPAGSGKSSTARQVAARLNYIHIDTGAMYRAITLKVLRHQIDVNDAETIGELAHQTDIYQERIDGDVHTFLDGEDVSSLIRTPEISQNVSQVASIPRVRQRLVQFQRQMGEKGGIVLEGRDIGTVVFPNAEIKIFMQASIEARAQRRLKDLQADGIEVDLKELEAEIAARDHADSTRQTSPLKQAPDAILLDTTTLTMEEQVQFIIDLHDQWLKSRDES
ncbi:MAG: (d)CMP kinase [Gemmatimonadetes bacterium]|nr:MAG: (d)CMP kinase [Gemmatimonadota bacterium]